MEAEINTANLSPEQKRLLLTELLQKKNAQEKHYPMSFSQMRLWFLDQLAPGNPFYNVEAAVPMAAALNINALNDSINEIIARHESLRTIFREVNGEPMQVVLPELKIEFSISDLRNIPASEREQEKQRLWTEIAKQAFDLEHGPLLRTNLLRTGQNEYLFILTMHHIIADGWSMGIFGRELEKLYSAFISGQPSPLAKLDIQYGDFAVWQRKWLSGDVLQEQLSYWQDKLVSASPLQLPTDHPRPTVQTFRGDFQPIELSKSLSDALKKMSREEGVTLFMTLLTAFKILLYRYSGQTDIVVGTYIANRDRAEIENLIGFFLNTLVLRTTLSGDPSFRELLVRVRETSLGAYAHQNLPFEKLVEELQPERDLSRNPIFQVTFQLQNAPTQDVDQGVQASLDFKRGTAIFDLAFMLFETKNGLRGQFEYSTELFEHSTIERMSNHYRMLLDSIIKNPDCAISSLPLLQSKERQQMLVEWTNTDFDYSFEQGIIQLFEEQVQQQGNAVAFIGDNEELSFVDLNVRANKIAHLLDSLNIKQGSIVAVCIERSLDQVVAMMGIWKAGAVYLPLDPVYPDSRLAFMLDNANSQMLITRETLLDKFTNMSFANICMDRDNKLIAGQKETDPDIRVLPDTPAYVIYTSGSTGQPKGILAPHIQIINRLMWMWRVYPFHQHEVCCQKTALSFVDSLWELLGPLLQGFPSVIVQEHTIRDPHAFVDILSKQSVTRLWLVPSLLQALLENYPDLQQRLPSVKFWVSSGENLSPELTRKFRELMPEAVLYNLYGTSEIWDATWYDTRDWSSAASRIPIGRAIDNVKSYILDNHLQPVPIGVSGELYISGLGLCQTIINRPDQKERIVHLSFPEASGQIAIGTGDSVRFLPDGNIEYIGRIDNQVKIRGYRVEPAEIEAILLAHPGIQRAVVVACHVGNNDIRLRAYVVSVTDDKPDEEELFLFLRSQLPEYMVPSSIHDIETMPLTPSGKVARKVLAERTESNRKRHAQFIAPATENERVLTQIWSEVLQVDKVGTQDNFFELGGHSLLATQVMSRVRSELQIEISLQRFFENPSIMALCQEIEKAKQVDGIKPEMGIPRLARGKYRTTRTENI